MSRGTLADKQIKLDFSGFVCYVCSRSNFSIGLVCALCRENYLGIPRGFEIEEKLLQRCYTCCGELPASAQGTTADRPRLCKACRRYHLGLEEWQTIDYDPTIEEILRNIERDMWRSTMLPGEYVYSRNPK